jgi:hypothetical protein
MRKIELMPLDRLQPGMILGKEVRGAQGALLLAAGTVLGEQEIEALGKQRVEQVLIATGQAMSPEEQAALRAAVEQRIHHLFRKSGDNPLMARLRDAVLAYRLEQLS